MKTKFSAIAIAVGIIFGLILIVYAISALFFTKSETSKLSKKTIFQFDLSDCLQNTEVAPGDTFTIEPTIYNDATEQMYVFIVVNQPTCNDESIYAYDVADDWVLLSDTEDEQVYAYASEEMIALLPGETTEALTNQMTMKNITNAEYSLIDDINVTITAYAIGTDGVPETANDAWEACKSVGNIS